MLLCSHLAQSNILYCAKQLSGEARRKLASGAILVITIRIMIETDTIAINPFFLPEADQFNLHGIAQVGEGKVSQMKFKALFRKIEELDQDKIVKLKPTLYNIAKAVCDHYQITINQLKSKSRKGDIMKARLMFCGIARLKTKHILADIGSFVNRDHATVLSSCKSLDSYRTNTKNDNITWEIFQTLKQKFYHEQ